MNNIIKKSLKVTIVSSILCKGLCFSLQSQAMINDQSAAQPIYIQGINVVKTYLQGNDFNGNHLYNRLIDEKELPYENAVCASWEESQGKTPVYLNSSLISQDGMAMLAIKLNQTYHDQLPDLAIFHLCTIAVNAHSPFILKEFFPPEFAHLYPNVSIYENGKWRGCFQQIKLECSNSSENKKVVLQISFQESCSYLGITYSILCDLSKENIEDMLRIIQVKNIFYNDQIFPLNKIVYKK